MGTYPKQVGITETNKLEPLLKRREEDTVVKTRDLNPSWDRLVRYLATGQAAAGVEEA